MRRSLVVTGGVESVDEQMVSYDVQDHGPARVQRDACAARFTIDLV